ncbi:mannosyltransferase KTR3 [Kluyveromyces lactis]|uniref:KLLA0E22991p n=1 Tax=Kluyveromyces lactis (strain ATCC 8585 / CBS 2359 / DSM 70799 / NBRC 1267 / NRRL Y-1140 / WM37) TaxID=284590 RepID=Q6CM50_KLULA|nr:uncharacterized protein KLLA0_E22991g [Kluyveromyces lactis]CAH00076.1 KLLA0E22991p [Kluyveromyces lactis]|eukprot:XP_454989.1 uncharacterized protein KLLA0_E22991g [Kluyveromyces lactis]
MQPKKKLMPKSAFLVKKYERHIRLLFIAFITVLCFVFITRSGNGSSETPVLPPKTVEPAVSSPGGAKDKFLKPHTDKVQNVFYPEDDGVREKACMVTLARNKDLWHLVTSVRDVEDRFNKNYHYDWVFLNDEPFNEEFKSVMTAMVSGTAKFGVIPKEHWSFPDWIDQDKAAEVRKQMKEDGIIYGDSVSYRHMCRYESGFFWRHELLDEYEWYWRVEPDIKLFCDIHYDVFKLMKQNNKKYGFILSVSEYEKTIPTLWETTKNFMKEYPQHVKENNLMKFISNDGGKTYNMCHFWSNFEIASLELWRSPAYREYFDYLDRSGGFFYERWGDAPIHSIAAALFLEPEEFHFFDGIGYYHPGFTSCPVEEAIRLQNRCTCDPGDDQTWGDSYFCTRKYFGARGLKLPKEVR